MQESDTPSTAIKLARISEAMSDAVHFMKIKMFIESLPQQDANRERLIYFIECVNIILAGKLMKFDLSGIVEPCMELKRIYSNGKRFYISPNNDRYMSVTTMLSGNTEAVMDAWRERVGEEEAESVSKFSSGIGTDVHNMIENTLLNVDNNFGGVNMLATSIYRSFLPHLKHISNIRGVELPMYSDTLKLAGTSDLIADYKGRLSLIDHKTSKYLKKREWLDNYFQQSTAYIIMFKERYGITINNIVLFIGSRDGEFQVVESKPKEHLKDLLQSNRKFNPLLK